MHTFYRRCVVFIDRKLDDFVFTPLSTDQVHLIGLATRAVLDRQQRIRSHKKSVNFYLAGYNLPYVNQLNS